MLHDRILVGWDFVFRAVRVCWGAMAALGLFIGMATAADAQTISQPVGTTVAQTNPNQGQSFTATVTGTVTQINIRSRSNGVFSLHLYNGGNGSGVSGSNGTPAYSQSFTLTDNGNDTTGFTPLVLTTPFPVTAGQQYSFLMSNGAASPFFSVNTTNPYAGGVFRANGNGGIGAWDAVFQVFEVATPPVPTLSEWAMIVLGLIMAGGAALYIQRRQMTV